MLFLEEIWSRNFTNLFIAPIKKSEILISLIFTALIRALIGLVPAILLTSPLFGISLIDLGLSLFLLFLSLYLFGITLGILVSSGLLRFGPSFENIAWSTMFLLAPFGCIYYPVETLPGIFQLTANEGLFLKNGLAINPTPHSYPVPAQEPLKFVFIQC